MGLTLIGCRGPQKPMEQGLHSSDVLTHPSKVWEGFIILNDPLVHITSHGTCAPTVFVVLDLTIELRTFLLELEPCFLYLSMSGF